jgi:hypothetical protein
MKKLALVAMVLCLMAGFAFAEEATTTTAAATIPAAATVIKGTIIDNACASANKDNLAEFIKTHPKSCALLPNCAASGYSIYTDGKLMKFDKDSNAKIEQFLKKDDSKLEVAIEVSKVADELSLVSIKNQ